MRIEFIDSINQVCPQRWQQLWATDYPFIQHGFLYCLEASHCVSAETGWQPSHILAWQGDELVAAMPLYIKTHSYGEYVFDWAWADAYHRNGLDYYPKLLNAIPFTPATGPRFAIAKPLDGDKVLAELLAAIQQKTEQLGASSFHSLFSGQQLGLLKQQGLMYRMGCQFHWFNRGYSNFDDFLAEFNSRKRKSLKRERRKVAEQGVVLHCVEAGDISPEQWQEFYLFYHLTYFKRSGRQGYLNQEFFLQLAEHCASQLMMVQAYHQEEMVAAALYFKGDGVLYGRYWGCKDDFDALHFEACYYQGIEYAIANGLQKFDPGAQGEHKIQRGFEPTEVGSCHWIADNRFSSAIEDFLCREELHSLDYLKQAESFLPFKAETQ